MVDPELSYSAAGTERNSVLSTTTCRSTSTTSVGALNYDDIRSNVNSDDQYGGVSLLDVAPDTASLMSEPLNPQNKCPRTVSRYPRSGPVSPLACAATHQEYSATYPAIADISKLSIKDSKEKRSTTGNLSNAWGEGSASAKLFPEAKSNAGMTQTTFEQGLRARNEDFDDKRQPASSKLTTPSISKASNGLHISVATSGGFNVFHQRFWDPDTPEYNPELFFSVLTEKYECPFPQCQYVTTTPKFFTAHLRTGHAIQEFRCPLCLRIFKSATAIVAHMTSPSLRCNIRNTSRFSEVLDRLSGGFLGMKQAKVYRDFETGELVEERPEEEGERRAEGAREELAWSLRRKDKIYTAERPEGMW